MKLIEKFLEFLYIYLFLFMKELSLRFIDKVNSVLAVLMYK